MHNLMNLGTSSLGTFISEVRYGDPGSFGGLTLIPLFSNRPAPFDYLLLLPGDRGWNRGHPRDRGRDRAYSANCQQGRSTRAAY